MTGWYWWIIWPALVIGGAIYLGVIVFDLAAKAKRAAKVAQKTAIQLETLSNLMAESAVLTPTEGNLLDDPAPLIAEYARNQRKRESKRLAEQRRLINKLIDYKADESEFHP
jgi:hypothetical protein